MTIKITKEWGIYLDKEYNFYLARPTDIFYPPYAPYFLKFLGTVEATNEENTIRIFKETLNS